MKKNCLATILLALILSFNTVALCAGKSTPTPSPAASKTVKQENSEKSEKKDDSKEKKDDEKDDEKKESKDDEKSEKKSEFPVPKAKAAIVLDTRSGDIIYSLNPDEKVYPAGLTNIMTAILTIEAKSLADTCTVTEEALSGITYDQPQLGMQVGDVYTVEQLLHAIILNSNNDASNVLAIAVSGSVDEFVKKMNEKAKDLGLSDTNFTNPSGLHNENHYTTASDMAYLAKYAMQNSTFASIAKTPKYTLPPTGSRTQDKTLLSTNHLISRYKYPYHFYANATGLKSGNSDDAGYCLAATATKNGFSVMSVIMGAQNQDANEKAYSFRDAIKIFDYVFDTYQSVLLAKEGDVLHDSKVREAKNSTRLALTVASDVYATLKKTEDKDLIKSDVEVTEDIKAPIKQGQAFGKVTFSYNGRKLKTVDLVAANEVKRDFILHIINSVLGFIFHPIVIIIIVVLAYFWVKLRIERNRKRRIRHSRMVSKQQSSGRTGTSTRPTSSSYSRHRR